MYTSLILSAFMLASCFTAPSLENSQAAKSAAAGTASNEPFPVPKEGLTIKVEPEADARLETLLNDFSRVTGQVLVINKEVRQLLGNTRVGINRSIDVPAQEVYPVVESILSQNDIILVPLSNHEPRLLAVESLNAGHRAPLLSKATFVPADQISAWARHPAILVSTLIDLPNTDVRTLSNSMRTLFTDQNTQLIIPVGNSNALIITGFGTSIAGIVAMLRATDEASRIAFEEMKKSGTPPRAKAATPKDPSVKEAPAAEPSPK